MDSSTEQTLETIEAMRRQEDHHGYYCVTDYLSELPKFDTATCSLDTPPAPVDALCRSVMATWCNEIAECCNYKKETVAIAMNCLDRFMATSSGQEVLLDRNLYQLASMTALYSSVKIHEAEAMDPKMVSRLSRGVHSAVAVEEMESKMLKAIEWRVNPPTAMSFVRMIIQELVPDHLLNPCEKETIIDLTRFQIELTVNEYNFSTCNGSSIAFACMLNAFESCGGSNTISIGGDGMFLANFETTVGKILFVDEKCILNLRIAIYELMNGGGDDNDNNDDNDNSNSTNCSRQKMLLNKNSSSSMMTNEKGLPGGATATYDTEGNIIDFYSTSPRTVATSCITH